MEKKHTQDAEAHCTAAFYGTSTPKREKNSHVGLVIGISLVVIALCTGSMLGALLRPLLGLPERGFLSLLSPSDARTGTPDIQTALDDDADCSAPVLVLEAGSPVPDETALAAVVLVSAEFSDGKTECSGVVFTQNGYLFTVCDNLQQAYGLQCTLRDGRTLPAAYLGRDDQTGVSLLKLSAADLTPAQFAGADTLLPGDSLRALCGQTDELVAGTVRLSNGKLLRSTAVCDAAVAGSVQLCEDGHVVGLTTTAANGSAAAIPAQALPDAIARILAQNPAARLWLGFDVGEIPPILVSYYDYPGFLWIRSLADTRLEEAGLYNCDIILSADGRSLTSWADFNEALAAHAPGEQIALRIYRDGAVYEASVRVRAR